MSIRVWGFLFCQFTLHFANGDEVTDIGQLDMGFELQARVEGEEVGG